MGRDRQVRRRAKSVGVALSVALHVALGIAVFSLWTAPPSAPERPPVVLALIEQAPTPAPRPSASSPTPAAAPLARNRARPTPVPANIEPIPAAPAPTPQPGLELSDAELAGAANAGSGAPGGGCDMARALQAALRKDALVQAAVAPGRQGAAAAGKVLRVWNGEWVSSPGEDGKGLAAVREALMWEIAFAPRDCREVPVKGLVVLSLADAPHAPRLAVGAGAWRWSDLLTPTAGFKETDARR